MKLRSIAAALALSATLALAQAAPKKPTPPTTPTTPPVTTDSLPIPACDPSSPRCDF